MHNNFYVEEFLIGQTSGDVMLSVTWCGGEHIIPQDTCLHMHQMAHEKFRNAKMFSSEGGDGHSSLRGALMPTGTHSSEGGAGHPSIEGALMLACARSSDRGAGHNQLIF